jgi:methane/ammonia monooxygenase subunit C
VAEIVVASTLWGYIWKTRDRNLAALHPREELRRNITHVVWLFAYAWAIYWGASYFTEQDGTWHQTIVRDTDFTPSHIIEFYLSYPIYIITGGASFLYAKTRLPFWSEGLSLPYLIAVTGPFMILPNVGLNEWGHTFWFMEELFVAPLHYGFVIFGWLALAIMGVLLQVFASFSNLIGKELCEAVDQGLISK